MPSSSTDTTDTNTRLLELNRAIQNATTTAEKNDAIRAYNAYIETLGTISIEEQFATYQSDSHSHSHPNSQKFTGINNILQGIKKNAIKGKYSHQDGTVLIRMLSDTVRILQEIDFTQAQTAAKERRDKFTNIKDKLDRFGL
jgi:hypothetical protein